MTKEPEPVITEPSKAKIITPQEQIYNVLMSASQMRSSPQDVAIRVSSIMRSLEELKFRSPEGILQDGYVGGRWVALMLNHSEEFADICGVRDRHRTFSDIVSQAYAGLSTRLQKNLTLEAIHRKCMGGLF